MNISSYFYNIGYICKNPIYIDEVIVSSQFNDFIVNIGICLGFIIDISLIISLLSLLIINIIK